MRCFIPLMLLPLLTSATLRPFPGKFCKLCRGGYKTRRTDHNAVDQDDPEISGPNSDLVPGFLPQAPGPEVVMSVPALPAPSRWGWARLERRAGWPATHPALKTRKRHPPFLPPVARFRSDSLGLGPAGLGLGGAYHRPTQDIFEEAQKVLTNSATLDDAEAAAAAAEAEADAAQRLTVTELLQELVRLREGELSEQNEQNERYASRGGHSHSPALVRYGILS